MAEIQVGTSTADKSKETRIFLGYFESKEKENFKDDSRRQSKTQQIAKLPRVAGKQGYSFISPRVVSIGPYDHGNWELQHTQDFKKKQAKKFVDTCEHHAHELYDKLFNEIQQMRDLYEKEATIVYSDQELTQLLFVDGCFVLHFIYCFISSDLEELKRECNLDYLLNDILKLENQLPFRVLELLLGENYRGYKKCRMIETFIEKIRSTLMPISVRKNKFRLGPNNSIHLLQLLHMGIVQQSKKDQLIAVSEDVVLHSSCSVRELKAVGIQFKPSRRCDFSYVVFNPLWFSRILKLPSIIIDEETRYLFLNLISYEQHLDVPVAEVQSYIRFLASLLHQPEDVKELQAAHILYNNTGDHEGHAKYVIDHLACFCSNQLSYRYINTKMQIEDYLHEGGKIKMALWLDEVIDKYFKSPWTVIAALAGFLFLSATILQSVYTVLPYYRH